MSLSLNPADIAALLQAVRLANRRGAFEIEESSQLIRPVQNLETWLMRVEEARKDAEQKQESSRGEEE